MSSTPSIWHFGSHSIDCTRPVLMGIVNVTPDSFSDGGIFLDTNSAVSHAIKLVNDGADILDIGGESTHPASDPVPDDEELNRVVPVIQKIHESGIKIPVSIDTRKLVVAKEAVKAGATIVNDVTALRDDPDMADFIAENNLGLVLMHMLGMPKTMQADPHYDDVIKEIGEFFEERLEFATGRGIPVENIAIDPGIGFGKLLEHNLRILNECGHWQKFKCPILIGPSRKRFIGEILDVEVDRRLYGTIGACVAALNAGARVFRVHDVGPVRDALEVAYSIMKAG